VQRLRGSSPNLETLPPSKRGKESEARSE